MGIFRSGCFFASDWPFTAVYEVLATVKDLDSGISKYYVLFCFKKTPQPFHPTGVFHAGGDAIDACGSNAGMDQNVGQFHNVFINPVMFGQTVAAGCMGIPRRASSPPRFDAVSSYSRFW